MLYFWYLYLIIIDCYGKYEIGKEYIKINLFYS